MFLFNLCCVSGVRFWGWVSFLVGRRYKVGIVGVGGRGIYVGVVIRGRIGG